MKKTILAAIITLASLTAFSVTSNAQTPGEWHSGPMPPQLQVQVNTFLNHYAVVNAGTGYTMEAAGWTARWGAKDGYFYVVFRVYFNGVLVSEIADPFQMHL